MDHRLVAWGRAVKARRRTRVPTLWLFSDPARISDLEAAVRALPRGLCGLVFRHDGAPCRDALLRRVARLCRLRRVLLVVAGDGSGPHGRHLRGGRLRRGRRARPGRGAVWTSSAHDGAELCRACRAGADLVFLSPVFATESHAGAPGLGPWRWARTARGSAVPVLALGGVTGANARRLPRWCAGAGAIGALLPRTPTDVTSAPQCFGFAIDGHGCRLPGNEARGNTSPRSG